MATAYPQGDALPAPAVLMGDSRAMATPPVAVPGDAPVRVIDGAKMQALSKNLMDIWEQYRRDRQLLEQRWLRNLRQYLGFYDPETLTAIGTTRSQAYPKLTRVKCLSLKARLMDLLFPSDDKNWTLGASPSHAMSPDDVKAAIARAQQLDQAASNQVTVDQGYVMSAVQRLADERADDLRDLIQDQLQELGGDQSYDYVALNGEVMQRSILFGVGVLVGPFVRTNTVETWQLDPSTGQPTPQTITTYMPQFETVPCWEFYPDMAAKRLEDGDGWFRRMVMSKRQLRKLADRQDFFGDEIKKFLAQNPQGNHVLQTFESELRTMGVKAIVNEQSTYTRKYEVIRWSGPIDGQMLAAAGVEVPAERLSDDIDAEVWMVGGRVIKAVMNPWVELGHDVRTMHSFLFDHDDTSPIGFGLPNVLRDTQMSVSNATRMMLDNASVLCGPMLEINRALMLPGQDNTSIHAYKIWYRDDAGEATAQYPAIREIKVESHIAELQSIIRLFLEIADVESFIGPATGGDMAKMPSEPMRNVAGASMLLGSAALPFKEIVRNFDRFTMSVIQALVSFNKVFNPARAKIADYDVIARGATSLIAKEVRGMQLDALATSLTDDEKLHVDDRKMAEARFRVRDMTDMLVSEDEAARRKAMRDASAAQMAQAQQELQSAQVRATLSQAFKNIAQGQKNQMGANAQAVETALQILIHGLENNNGGQSSSNQGAAQGGGGQASGDGAGASRQPIALPPPGPTDDAGIVQPGGPGGMFGGGVPQAAG